MANRPLLAFVPLLLSGLRGATENQQGAFFEACKDGDLSMVRELLSLGANISAHDEDGLTPLHWAAQNNKLDVARLLLEKSADLEARDKNGWTPLRRAVDHGHVELMRFLLERKANLEARSDGGWTPLTSAAYNRNLKVTQFLLEQGAKIEARTNSGRTVLSEAASGGDVRVLRLLLEKGARLEARESDGATPVAWAAYSGRLNATRLLLESGAKVDAHDKDGWAALHWAVWRGHSEVVRLLLEHNATVDAPDTDRATPLSWAAYLGHWEITRLLLREGANVDASESHGWAPLHLAVRASHPEVVGLLLQKGANIEARNADGWAPLHVAAFFGDGEMVSLLLKYEADTSARDEPGFCAGNLAEARGHLNVSRQLLPCTRTGGEWLQHTVTSPGFWEAVGLAVVLLFATRWLARPDSSFQPLAPNGASLLAATAVYPSHALLAVKLYRAVEVFSNTALPMYLMLRLSPALWSIVLLLVYALPALVSSSNVLEKPLLVIAASRHSLLRLDHWNWGLLGFLWAPGRLGLLLALAYFLRPGQFEQETVRWHQHELMVHNGTFHHCAWCNPRGEEALLVAGTNPVSNLCLPLPETIAESLQKGLWKHRPPWEIVQGNCTREAATFCITSPGWPHHYTADETCRITVPSPATFLVSSESFKTEVKYDFLGLNGQNYSGEIGPSGMVPMGDILWHSDRSQEWPGWRLCPDTKQVCFPFWSIQELLHFIQIVGIAIAIAYAVVSLVMLAAALHLRFFKCKRDNAQAVADVTAEILATIEEHPAPEQAVTVVSRIKGSGGRFVQPTSVLQASIFLLLDLVLDLNTVRVLMVSENYMFAAIIAAASIGSTVIELRHGGFSEVMSAIRETRRTGVPTAAYRRMMGAEMGEAWVSLLVTSYAIPFSVRSPMDLMSVSLSLLSSSWSLASYLLEQLDVGKDVFSSKSIESESTASSSASDSCGETESQSVISKA